MGGEDLVVVMRRQVAGGVIGGRLAAWSSF
jgi:hypothetical protein